MEALEVLFWLSVAIGGTVVLSVAVDRRRKRTRQPDSIYRDRALAGHPADCACRDDRTIHMWNLPAAYERRDS